MPEYTPKQRMLNAYRGIPSDRAPVAPEFWTYYPAKLLGVDMVEFEREIPFWQSLRHTFAAYGCEGWGAVFPEVLQENVETSVAFERTRDGCYRETVQKKHRGNLFRMSKIYTKEEPSWPEERWAGDGDPGGAADMLLDMDFCCDFTEMRRAYRAVGGGYLLEVWLGVPFFDFMADMMGFERAIVYFLEEEEQKLEAIRARYTEYRQKLADMVCENTPYESFAIGCSYSCNSLLGPVLWRKWDKPYIARMAEALHKNGKLLHIHFHGKSMETAKDFLEMGVDCVCPFERPKGGDVDGINGLLAVREALGDRVTFNGNVHTVDTLINGKPRDVRREVREIKRAFAGSSRYIIGTGDQVGYETPEENIIAMIEEAKA